MVLGGNDDYHGEDGTQNDGGNAHCQADEGEVTRLAGRYLCRHHVPPGHCCTHLRGGRRERENAFFHSQTVVLECLAIFIECIACR